MSRHSRLPALWRVFTVLALVLCMAASGSATFAADILTQSFEGGWVGWTQEKDAQNVAWAKSLVDHSGGGAYGGSYFALLYSTIRGTKTVLVTPALGLNPSSAGATLEFWHRQKHWGVDQDTLKVYYKITATGTWTLLATCLDDTPVWTKRTMSLPNPSATYYVGFEGMANYGYGVCIDDVRVFDSSSARTPVAVRISDLANAPVPPNPLTLWGVVTAVSPVRINDGSGEIALSGVTASVGDYVIVTGNLSGDVLTATEPALIYPR
jgi:hypothetical protein